MLLLSENTAPPPHDAPRRRARREHHDQLLARAHYLPRPDRLFLEQVLRHHITLPALAHVAGQPLRAVRARYARLIRRLNHPLFLFTVTRFNHLPPELRRPASLIFIQGRSQRAAAQLLRCSHHQLRLHLQSIHTLARNHKLLHPRDAPDPHTAMN